MRFLKASTSNTSRSVCQIRILLTSNLQTSLARLHRVGQDVNPGTAFAFFSPRRPVGGCPVLQKRQPTGYTAAAHPRICACSELLHRVGRFTRESGVISASPEQ